MKILVTGSSGFIGGHLVTKLNAFGHEVFGIDYFTIFDNDKAEDGGIFITTRLNTYYGI